MALSIIPMKKDLMLKMLAVEALYVKAYKNERVIKYKNMQFLFCFLDCMWSPFSFINYLSFMELSLEIIFLGQCYHS